VSDGGAGVVIVGGGFSGAMLAARLAECGVACSLIDRTGTFGPGLAYSTPFEGHLLNVRSDRMSAVEGRPGDFVDWLRDNCPQQADPDGFAPRRLYGEYLLHRLNTVRLAHPGMIELITGEVAAIGPDSVRLSDGRIVSARAVVLATGNPAPKTAGKGSRRIITDPWALTALERIGPDDEVIIVGTGLTMVDMVLWLDATGRRGRITALSRRGLMPRVHGATHDHPGTPTEALLTGRLSGRLAEARRLTSHGDWRGLMEGLRPLTAGLWFAADAGTRARWLRHLRPWWDVHRHRIPIHVDETVKRFQAAGRLGLVPGRIERIEAGDDRVALHWRARDGSARSPITGQWLIDCTGPGHAPLEDPLTGPLIKARRARLDPVGLGLDLDAEGRLRAADGSSDARLFALGPPARAAFWETTAVPDIRKRIEGLVDRLAGAQVTASR
jgi:uncharacterized NAD(P)/FAD-binding protein YdhS